MPKFKKHFTGVIRSTAESTQIECPECDSKNVIFEEYIRPRTPDESDLGIKCEDCGYKEDPEDYGNRFEPTEPEEWSMKREHGWIKIHRDLKDHWIFANAEYLKAWIDLLMMANHKTKKWLVQDQMVLIKRGELITSLAELAKQWGWSRGKVRRYITMLENDTMVVRKSTHLWTHLTICNYGTYQDLRPTDSTTDGQQTVQPTDTTKECKERQECKECKEC